ncbi:hypothetical protein FB451DRAFT_1568433 [Mycena latifolia]|nr:hypothetical protein FB451DRAFT_1568433 [Mycena latifolia]
MPSAFDILGAIAFAQGVITVLITINITLLVRAQETFESVYAIKALKRRLEKIPVADLSQDSQNEYVRINDKLRRGAAYWLVSLTRMIFARTKPLQELTAQVSELEAEAAQTRLVNAVGEVVSNAFRNAGLAPHGGVCAACGHNNGGRDRDNQEGPAAGG